MNLQIAIAKITEYTRPEWGNSYGHHEKFVWSDELGKLQDAIRKEYSNYRERHCSSKSMEFTRYYRLDECAHVIEVDFIQPTYLEGITNDY